MHAADPDREHTPEFYRQRYLELKARAQDTNSRRSLGLAAESPRVICPDLIVTQEIIPGGWYWSRRIARGMTLRILNEHGTPGVSLLMWNAHETSERLNPADTIKVQWTSRLTHGKLLLSDMGRVLAAITHDTSGMHDAIAGGSTAGGNLRKFGPDVRVRNTRDNFLLAAAKHGLDSRDVGPCITFFAPVTTDSSGRLVWQEGALANGDFVDLRIEMDVLVALSNCPHPLSPATASTHSIRAIVWQTPPHDPKDPCRNATEEAMRAFENTDSYLEH